MSWSHKEKRPRIEIESIIKIIDGVMKNHTKISIYEVCGSYRRQKDMVGDLEILIGVLDINNACIIQNDIAKVSDSVLVRGQRNMSVLINGVQVDTKVAVGREWPFALLHFTGNSMFNIVIRATAKRMGYKLNEKGIFLRESNDRLLTYGSNSFQTEKDIFDFLNTEYKEPKDRSI